MKLRYLPTLIFLILLIWTCWPFDFAFSVIPGFHRRIISSLGLLTLLLMTSLTFAVAGYWYIQKASGKIDWYIFRIHLLLTLPLFIFLNWPLIFNDAFNSEPNSIVKNWESLHVSLTVMLLIGQVIFIFHLVKSVRRKAN